NDRNGWKAGVLESPAEVYHGNAARIIDVQGPDPFNETGSWPEIREPALDGRGHWIVGHLDDDPVQPDLRAEAPRQMGRIEHLDRPGVRWITESHKHGQRVSGQQARLVPALE